MECSQASVTGWRGLPRHPPGTDLASLSRPGTGFASCGPIMRLLRAGHHIITSRGPAACFERHGVGPGPSWHEPWLGHRYAHSSRTAPCLLARYTAARFAAWVGQGRSSTVDHCACHDGRSALRVLRPRDTSRCLLTAGSRRTSARSPRKPAGLQGRGWWPARSPQRCRSAGHVPCARR